MFFCFVCGVEISRSSTEATIKKISKNAKRYGCDVSFDNVEFVFGNFKKINFGITEGEIENLFTKIGAVYSLAMSTSYSTPIEVMRMHWMPTCMKLVNMCHKTGVQLHWVGGQGAEVCKENQFQRYHRDFLCNGYFRFKGTQEIIMGNYTKKGLYGTNYQAPYFVGPYNNGNPPHPGFAHTLTKFIKMNQLCGWYDHERIIELAILSTGDFAEIMVKGVELFRKGENKHPHMNLWNWVGGVKQIGELHGCKNFMTIKEYTKAVEDTFPFEIREYYNVGQYAQLRWGLQYFKGTWCCPDWAKEILDRTDGEVYMRAYCDSIKKLQVSSNFDKGTN